MNRRDISTLKMIACNCSLEKIQRDMLNDIIGREEKHIWYGIDEGLHDGEREVIVCLHGIDKNIKYQRGYESAYYVPDEGFYENKLKNDLVIAWRDIEPYEED